MHTDHPRSRGVYGTGPGRSSTTWGSSPLARGLPRSTATLSAILRIIPARAGFTTGLAPNSVLSRDHPRSRGVYPTNNVNRHHFQGSSPLARGLLQSGLVLLLALRIIPARAGFTTILRTSSPATRDHPRSRGVYSLLRTGIMRRLGSSPLARGLPTRSVAWPSSSRIIPARAGFTLWTTLLLRLLRDHPRSRGVYSVFHAVSFLSLGSSPLARGLLNVSYADVPSRRIIPARAGFTGPGRWSTMVSRDHPRSRGVYYSSLLTAMRRTGSSPLARGLQFRLSRRMILVGIIPARAGFTGKPYGAVVCEGDHPRSRGVYPGEQGQLLNYTGSSPLARGLHRRSHRNRRRVRIIPARAGFTGVCSRWLCLCADHPRSRGVYCFPW